jgi:hypothetical protein
MTGPGRGAAAEAEVEATAARPHPSRRLLLHPLAAICALQAALSLSLVWSNTAFADEAYYLWAGHLEIAHWLHGASLPQAFFQANLSGSPVLYPPLGALADSIGGLAGARILSLGFMLGATILLYATASRLFGRTAAIAASALWSVAEPTLRLAFATYDPVSVSLTALAVWLAVEAGYRRHRYALVFASSASLALSDAVAYSGIVMAPVVVVFAFTIWLPRMPIRQAVYCVASAIAGWLAFFGLLIIISRSWSGLEDTVLHRTVHDHTDSTVIVTEVLRYGYIVMLLAVAGAVAAVAVEGYRRAVPVIVLACAALVVPLGQLHYHSSTSIDKHIAYGLWLAAMPAGYGVAKLISMPSPRLRSVIALCCAIVFLFAVVDGWQKAWGAFHSWANATSFVSSFRPIAGQAKGPILAPAAALRIDHISEYYTSEGADWGRWQSMSISLDPAGMGRNEFGSFYAKRLHAQKYGVIALAFETRPAAMLPGSMRLPPRGSATYNELIRSVKAIRVWRGLPYLIQALERDPSYRLVAVGRYGNSDRLAGFRTPGLYAIWERVPRG